MCATNNINVKSKILKTANTFLSIHLVSSIYFGFTKKVNFTACAYHLGLKSWNYKKSGREIDCVNSFRVPLRESPPLKKTYF